MRTGHGGPLKGTSTILTDIVWILVWLPLFEESQQQLTRKLIGFPHGWYMGGSLGQHNFLNSRFSSTNPLLSTELCIPNECVPEKWGRL